MENYELDIQAPPKRRNNWFHKGHVPFNKGRAMKEWMDGRKIRKVKKYLELGRKAGNHDLPGANKKKIVAIGDGKLIAFRSAVDAEKILRAKGIKINRRNINSVCNEKIEMNGGRPYIREKAGGFRWFFADQPEKYGGLLS